jgi:hypothetical protein
MANKSDPKGTILMIWDELGEEDKAALVPQLLTRTEGWSVWGFSDSGIVSWLKWVFDAAKIPFRHGSFTRASQHGRIPVRAPRRIVKVGE